MKRRNGNPNDTTFMLDYDQLFACNKELALENARLKSLLRSYDTCIKENVIHRISCVQALRQGRIVYQTAAEKIAVAVEAHQISCSDCKKNSEVLNELGEDLVHLHEKLDGLLNNINVMKNIQVNLPEFSPTSEPHTTEEDNVPSCAVNSNVEVAHPTWKRRYSVRINQGPASLSVRKGQSASCRNNRMFVLQDLEERSRPCTQTSVMESPMKVPVAASLQNIDLQDSADVMMVSPPRASTSGYPEPDVFRDNGHTLDSIECPSVWDEPLIMEEDINEWATNDIPYNLRKRKNEKKLDPFLDASWLQDSTFCNETIVDPGDTTFVLEEKRKTMKTKGKMKKPINQPSCSKRKVQKN
ncbi:uncharacterized protein [Anabrus simplex]|uniref:uncharacterized protein n=1 Tax=Anabrus simplex TaxID=316456 RepID=UPI0035A3D306